MKKRRFAPVLALILALSLPALPALAAEEAGDGFSVDKGIVTYYDGPGGDITFARASYWSICGNVTTSWERTENGYRLTVGIPANTTAEILLPDGTGRTVGAGQHRYEWK